MQVCIREGIVSTANKRVRLEKQTREKIETELLGAGWKFS